jgi:hypothetical protein
MPMVVLVAPVSLSPGSALSVIWLKPDAAPRKDREHRAISTWQEPGGAAPAAASGS